MQRRRGSPSKEVGSYPLQRAGVWLNHHARDARTSLDRLLVSPFATFMTVAVIAVSLALPAGLYLLTQNLNALSASWSRSASISLFLKLETDIARARELAARLQAHPDLMRITLISPEEALLELGSHSGFREAIAQLDENPLPVVLALEPAPRLSGTALERLVSALQVLPEADFARLDSRWILRFRAILNLAEHGVVLVGSGLALAVLLIVGNTIRLEIQNRRDEIEIMELVGATRGFILRPFLYTGTWYGFLGGVGAWLLIEAAVALLAEPVSRLAFLYHSEFKLSGLRAGASIALVAGSSCLGLFGSWFSVGGYLVGAEPRR